MPGPVAASAAALALTMLFVPDEPRAPVVAIDLVETGDGRTVDVVVIPAAGDATPLPTPFTTHLRSPPVDGSTRLRSLPVAPDGAAVTDVVDGVLVTIDDVGAWVPAPPTAPLPTSTSTSTPKGGPAKKGAASSSSPPAPSLPLPPSLPVASTHALRLFVPTVEPGRAVPASLHGVGEGGAWATFSGQALVVTRPRPALALSVADVDGGKVVVHAFDASVPVLTGALGDECTAKSSPTTATAVRALQRVTHLALGRAACSGALVVVDGQGTRLGDRPERDRPARGLVVVRR